MLFVKDNVHFCSDTKAFFDLFLTSHKSLRLLDPRQKVSTHSDGLAADGDKVALN